MAKFTFRHEEDGSLPLDSAVFQALGWASTCWIDTDEGRLFDEASAVSAGDALLAFIIDWHFSQNAVARESIVPTHGPIPDE